ANHAAAKGGGTHTLPVGAKQKAGAAATGYQFPEETAIQKKISIPNTNAMYYPGKMTRIIAIVCFVSMSSIALSQTNTPVSTPQVPAATSVAGAPGAYNAGAGINYVRTRDAMARISDGSVFGAA